MSTGSSQLTPPDLEGDWRPVLRYEGVYWVSSAGELYGIRRKGSAGGLLRPTLSNSTGYMYQNLCLGGVSRPERLHVMVAEAFYGERPLGHYVRHLDGDRTHNHLANLAFGTPSDNSYDTVRHGRHPAVAKTHCKHGHEFTPENTILVKGGPQRQCRECARRRSQEYRDRRKAAHTS